MSRDESSARTRSRRAMLGAALGGVAAAAAGLAGRVNPVAAAAGDPLFLGQVNGEGQSSTVLRAGSDSPAFDVRQSGEGAVISALHRATSGRQRVGLVAETRNAKGIGVIGRSVSQDTAGSSSSTGVFGVSALGRGVMGLATAESGQTFGVLGTVHSPDGWAGYFVGPLYTSSRFDLQVIAEPGPPAGNRVRLFARDNGSGKGELCVQFATGPVVVLATES